ncbi:uncharacterized protein LOC128202080 [Galleria mellonella]|uniref:Uncharacterized protein LOC128202080 n=1 Tax=Galleria mellonella TaxID=7137 RepID=A0ABM3N0Q7_GALME|nr:uncharacterized protein LOC128202080 [Galleria mellonella]
MEGGGEGMVAIVSSFKDAGLAVTLVDSRYDEPDRRATARRCWLPQARSSVETNTDAVKSHAGTQICDGRYASSYQLAHCSLKPTSPSVHLPEFPLQKTTPFRNKGNFEVGWQNTGEYSYRLGTTQLQRNSFTYTDHDMMSINS